MLRRWMADTARIEVPLLALVATLAHPVTFFAYASYRTAAGRRMKQTVLLAVGFLREDRARLFGRTSIVIACGVGNLQE
jgi:hypothetical protein